MNRTALPVLITDAQPSPERQLRSREIRYVVMMGIRAVCLVVAAILVSRRVPLAWLWVSVCLAGMVVLPWLAVLLANDGPPKPEHRLLDRGRPTSNATSDERVTALEPAGYKVIEADP